MMPHMRSFTIVLPALAALVAVTLSPASGLAGSFETKELGGCQIPLLPGAKMASEQSNTFENGNLVYNAKGAQHMVFWFPGASGELAESTVKVYAEAFGKSGAWLGVDSITWEQVEGGKAARLPVKMSADQPVEGRMLMWASVATGRYFKYVLTPSWSRSGKASLSAEKLDALLTEAGGLVSCEGAGKVAAKRAVIDPAPEGYTVDTADTPNLAYLRKLGGHRAILWRATVAGDATCVNPAETLFAGFVNADPSLSFAGPAEVVADNLDGSEEGPRCDVSRPIKGMSSEGVGDFARYLAYACPDDPASLILAMELVSGGVADRRLDVSQAVCASELPGTALEQAVEAATPAAERVQWVPGSTE